MSAREPTVTYLELRESNPDGSPAAGLSHTGKGLVLLHVQELAADGEPRGAVTFVHDAGGHGGLFLGAGERLARAGWAVALPDLRGHGRSEGPRGHTHGIQEILRDLGDVQDHVAYRQPEAPKVLVGQGLGALWALAFACERPGAIAALALAGTLTEPRFEIPGPPGGLKRLFHKSGPLDEGRVGWDAAQRASDVAAQALLAREPAHATITRRAAEQAAEAAQRYLPRLASLGLPVLVLRGGGDAIAPRFEPHGAVLREIESARHDVFLERSGAAADALARWLDECLPRQL
jgi:alpha-beta hydrolase superfamily lysophospholipase